MVDRGAGPAVGWFAELLIDKIFIPLEILKWRFYSYHISYDLFVPPIGKDTYDARLYNPARSQIHEGLCDE